MALLTQIKNRYSVRAYQRKPVEKEKLLAVLEAARQAPSAKNFQEWRFVVVQDEATRRKLMAAANNQTFVGEAPAVIVCCATNTEYVMRCGQLCYPIDLAIAIDHMTLQAVEEGLGTCWVGSFVEEQVKALLGIPKDIRVVGLLPLGYSADHIRPKNRLPLNKVACFDKWQF